jgi:hypothetical protein
MGRLINEHERRKMSRGMATNPKSVVSSIVHAGSGGTHTGSGGTNAGSGGTIATRQGSGPFMINENGRKIYPCHLCGKFGHYRGMCPNKEYENYVYSVTSLNKKPLSSTEWTLDSGATTHFCKSKENFLNLNEAFKCEVVFGNGSKRIAAGIGTILLKLHDNGTSICLKDVLYTPDVVENLISVTKLVEEGISVVFDQHSCYMLNNSNEKFTLGKKMGKSFIVNGTPQSTEEKK